MNSADNSGMPSRARIIVPGIPHHIVQRGNHKTQVFFSKEDRQQYLLDVRKHATKQGVKILAYCLMDNHTHFVLIPESNYSFARMFGPLHTVWSRRLSKMKESVGRNLQGRYFSAPMDDTYTIRTIAYIHLNPVRAKIVAKATEYEWSSAAAHQHLQRHSILDNLPEWEAHISASINILKTSSNSDGSFPLTDAEQIRTHTTQNIPMGSELFIRSIESLTGRSLRKRTRSHIKQ